MHFVEPFFNWRNLYIASDDQASPFYKKEYSEFLFHNKIYNFFIHPQWDSIDSKTLFIKILFIDYEKSYGIIEMIGEWNDAIENDIMKLKRGIIDELTKNGIDKFILIGENILNFHYSDDCYYEEWLDDIENGWVATINFHQHVIEEFKKIGIDQYFIMGGEMEMIEWRTYLPDQLYKKINSIAINRLK